MQDQDFEIIQETDNLIEFIHPLLQDPTSCNRFRTILHTELRTFAVTSVLEIKNKDTIAHTEIWTQRLGSLIVVNSFLSADVNNYSFLLKVDGYTKNKAHRLVTTEDLILISVNEKILDPSEIKLYPSPSKIFDKAELFPLRENESIEFIIHVTKGSPQNNVKHLPISAMIHKKSPQYNNAYLISIETNGIFSPREVVDIGLQIYKNMYLSDMESEM